MAELKTTSALVPAARQEGKTVVAAVAGEIDLNNSPELRQTLMDLIGRAEPAKLVLNLERVPYMDSSAIAVLVELLRKLGKGGKVVLSGLQPRVKGLLEIARLNSIFGIVGTEQEAMAL
jgi:anti-anti-sigma factor